MIINLAKIRFGGTGNTGGGAPAKPEDSFQETYTANGNYDVVPQAGHVFSGGHVEVDVHPTESLSLTITESGSYTSNDEFNGYSINVDVEGPKPEETLTQTITENGSHVFNPSEGHVFNSASITVEVPGITPTGTINISANGTYDVTDKATAVVAVGGTDYRYRTGTPDVAGLTAIGWTADDIGYYGANAPHYAWENDNYKVSQKNIDLYSLDDPQPSLYKDNPNVTFVPNKNMSTYFGGNNGFVDMKYIRSIPWYDTSNDTFMGSKFSGCSSLQTIPPLDTSRVTKMYQMFNGCSSLTSIPQLDTSNVTDMSNMFKGCSSLQTIPLLDTSNVTNMSDMFNGCSSLQTIPLLDTSKVTGTSSLFKDCTRLKSVVFDQSSLAKNSSGTVGYYSMFNGCSSLERVKFTGSTPTTGGNHVQYMFYGCNNLQSVEGVDFSKVSDNLNYLFGFTSKLPSLTRFIVIGKINASSTDNYGFYATSNLDYDSIKSILEAMNRTDNTSAKTMKFNTAAMDLDGVLTALVASCATKGWTITGLTLYEEEIIESITPSKEHITVSNLNKYGDYVTLSVNSRVAWQAGGQPKQHGDSFGIQYDYYDANTDELTRTGTLAAVSGAWTPRSGSIGETVLTPDYGSWAPSPKSGEYALVGISFRTSASPYMYYDYYFKVYPDGE